MNKLFTLSLGFIFSTSLAQAGSLFSLKEESGLVAPENQYQLSCEISQEGVLNRALTKSVKVGNNWEMRVVESERIPLIDTLLMQMTAQLEKAAHGKLNRRQAPCDVGSTSYMGNLKGAVVPLRVMENCEQILSNTAPEAQLLITKLRELCKSN